MVYFMKSGNQRFELRKVELGAGQSKVPEDFRNLARGFCFTLHFYYTTEIVYPHRLFESVDNTLQCNFHIKYPQLYTEDEDSLPGKLLASFSGKDLPEDVQKAITNIIVDETKSTPYQGYKVEPILVQIGIVKVESMKDSLFRSKLITHEVKEGSLTGEQCVICLERFSSGGETVLIPCSHIYHRNCITKWLETALHCPTCRLAIEPSDDQQIATCS
ncbi:hypothetical protein Ddye_005893 [Dipteronia dyeriana]|uniref:RING-type domain-containing protein n=1 Tax=Dipteronia dyeriana TaxID=168575 RepID=A0AAD9XHB5_9ROSI|nr:hypothetical protein Ddye_005893 [Dipteronia dyeriana]